MGSRSGYLAFIAVLLSGSAACNESQLPTGPVAPGGDPRFQISDGANGGANPHFFFLPPIQPDPSFSGTFDPALSPTVRICALSGSTCSGPDISTFSMTSTPPIVIDPVGENYQVKWDTGGLGLLTSVDYRIEVFAGNVLLGFADVDVVPDNKGLKSVSAGFVGLVRNKTLQIKFRIETGIVGQVLVEPAAATILVGETQQYTATLTDLHGDPLSGPPITWTSDNTGVAAVDGTGLATGTGDGTATITAMSQNVNGIAILTVVEFVSVSAGGDHSCGLTAAGAAYCWGYNVAGQLGDGTNIDSSMPIAVAGSHTFASVNAGGKHTCGLTTAGAAYCWGLNAYGQLGNGPGTDSYVPVPVSGGYTFASVSAGGSDGHSCGVTTAGTSYCWGNNAYGQLGDGTNADSNVPVAVTGSYTFASVSAGGSSHSCGLTTAGAAYCWGFNGYNQLGDGTNVRSNVPVAVSGSHTFASVDAGGHHSCGVTTAAAVYCWGHNAYGDLGRGTNTNGEGVPLEVSGSHAFAFVSAGVFHSCGVTNSGATYCWGHNANGNLGNGTNSDSNVPVAVAGSYVFASVSGGGFLGIHSCGLTTAGVAYCWGGNSFGQLGDGTNINGNVPVAVSLN